MSEDLRRMPVHRLLELRDKAYRNRRDPYQRQRIAKLERLLAAAGYVAGV
jgi:hypothetical protein